METIAYAVIYAFAFLFGICIGSFLNVLIYRVPRGINVAKGRSFCPRCNNTLLARDLVPLVSFGLLGGRCRFCGAKISWRYPIIEALGGMLGILSVMFWFISWQALLIFAATCVLLTISFIDYDTQEIPDVLNIVLMGMAVAAIFLFPEISIISRIIGFFEISVLMIIINLIKKESFGGGDIKLCAAAGFFLGWQNMLLIMPAVNRSQTADSNYLKAKAKAQDMKMTIAGKDTAKMEIKDLAKELKSIDKYFPRSLQSEKVDKLTTNIIQRSSLKPVSLTINGSDSTQGSTSSSSNSSSSSTSGTSGSNASGSTSSSGSTASSGTSGLNSATNSAASNAENQGNAASGSNNGSSTEKVSSKNLKYDTVSISATGSMANCLTAIENARKTKGICIVSFMIQRSGSVSSSATLDLTTGSVSSGNKGGCTLDMVLQVWQRISTN